MELYPHERTPGLTYARIGYHYGRPGMTDDHRPITPEELRAPRLPDWMPAARMGANNSVMHQTEALPGGSGVAFDTGSLYAGGPIPVWRPVGAGARWRLSVPVEEDGEYRVHFVARLDPRAPAIEVLWDGEPAQLASGTSIIDLYRPYRTLLRNFTLQQRHLTAGSHILEFSYPEVDDRVGQPQVGIDFVWVQNRG